MFGQNTWFINPQNKAELFRTYQPEGSELKFLNANQTESFTFHYCATLKKYKL